MRIGEAPTSTLGPREGTTTPTTLSDEGEKTYAIDCMTDGVQQLMRHLRQRLPDMWSPTISDEELEVIPNDAVSDEDLDTVELEVVSRKRKRKVPAVWNRLWSVDKAVEMGDKYWLYTGLLGGIFEVRQLNAAALGYGAAQTSNARGRGYVAVKKVSWARNEARLTVAHFIGDAVPRWRDPGQHDIIAIMTEYLYGCNARNRHPMPIPWVDEVVLVGTINTRGGDGWMRLVQVLVDALLLSKIEITELEDAALRWKMSVIVEDVIESAATILHGAINDPLPKRMPKEIIGVITAALLGTSNVRHESATQSTGPRPPLCGRGCSRIRNPGSATGQTLLDFVRKRVKQLRQCKPACA